MSKPITPATRQAPQADREGISVVVPVYNEEGAIAEVLAALHALMAAADRPFEIIVVDDGSTDASAARVRQVIDTADQPMMLIQHGLNRGYGAALKTGLRYARYDLAAITDADGTYPNELIPNLADQLVERHCAMVVGARTGAQVAIPWVRRPAKWIIGRLANWIAGQPIPDLNSGLRVFRRRFYREVATLLPDGFSFTTTITLGLLAYGHRVDYVPINYHPRVGRSKIRPIYDTLNFIQLILRIGLYFAPLKIFFSASGLLLLLAIVWGVLSAVIFDQLADVSTLVIVLTAIQLAGIGLVAELINRRTALLHFSRYDRDAMIECAPHTQAAPPLDYEQYSNQPLTDSRESHPHDAQRL